MRIAIIGRGRVAQALARALRAAHEIRFGVRAGHDGTTTLPIGEAAEWGEVIVLATPFAALDDVAAGIYPQASGKIVIDSGNPVGMTPHGPDMIVNGDQSAAEILQKRLPTARVVKAFNQVGAEHIGNPARLTAKPVQFVSGDDPEARATVSALVAEAGFEPAEFGRLANARYLEALALIWIWSAMKGPLGRDFALSLTRPRT